MFIVFIVFIYLQKNTPLLKPSKNGTFNDIKNFKGGKITNKGGRITNKGGRKKD